MMVLSSSTTFFGKPLSTTVNSVVVQRLFRRLVREKTMFAGDIVHSVVSLCCGPSNNLVVPGYVSSADSAVDKIGQKGLETYRSFDELVVAGLSIFSESLTISSAAS